MINSLVSSKPTSKQPAQLSTLSRLHPYVKPTCLKETGSKVPLAGEGPQSGELVSSFNLDMLHCLSFLF